MPEKKYKISNYYDIPQDNESLTISSDLVKWVSDLAGKIKYAKNNLNTDQRGLNPEFWDRLRAESLETIPEGDYEKSHKMSYAEADGKYYIYPEVQNLGNGLIDYSKSPYKNPFEIALENNNYIIAPNENIAKEFSEKYKNLGQFPSFTKNWELENYNDQKTLKENPTRIRTMLKYLSQQGLPKEKIAAIMGSAFVEDPGLDPYKPEMNGGKGYGLFQHTYEIRKEGLNNYTPSDYMSEIERQLSYMLKELEDPTIFSTGYKGKRKWDNAKTLDEAVKTFAYDFENPKDAHIDRRSAVAKYIYDNFDKLLEEKQEIKSIF